MSQRFVWGLITDVSSCVLVKRKVWACHRSLIWLRWQTNAVLWRGIMERLNEPLKRQTFNCAIFLKNFFWKLKLLSDNRPVEGLNWRNLKNKIPDIPATRWTSSDAVPPPEHNDRKQGRKWKKKLFCLRCVACVDIVMTFSRISTEWNEKIPAADTTASRPVALRSNGKSSRWDLMTS